MNKNNCFAVFLWLRFSNCKIRKNASDPRKRGIRMLVVFSLTPIRSFALTSRGVKKFTTPAVGGKLFSLNNTPKAAKV